ncbi:hypothetical protein I4U23_018578 [Adineta vaga]|nr:hypothetical protein I4U23_018578 [Adineta vaga]
MSKYQDSVDDYGNIQRNHLSSMGGNDYSSNQNHRELDEIETSKGRHILKKSAKFLVSHVGLVGLVVVYAVAGGFLFELLEQHQEKLNCQEAEGEHRIQIMKLKQKIVSYIQYNTTTTSLVTLPSATYVLERDNQTVAYEKLALMLTNYREFIITTGTKYRYYGDSCSVVKWTFANSLLFAITIITTIGYGNITPMTWEGQVCCICYATIGIPIFLLCIANISGVLGEMFRFLYARICCGACYMMKRRRALARKAILEENGMNNNNNRGNGGGWEVDDNNPDSSEKKQPANSSINQAEPDENELLDGQRVTVPLTITMCIIAFYIWAGSMIFHSFEQWDMTEAGYFCFITLATIGFGDFVPGQRKDDPAFKLILGAIYVLFGMAILAMCFDLMQEEIVAKFRWIGRKVGILEKEEDPSASKNNKSSSSSDTSRPSTAVSTRMSSPVMNKNGKISDDDYENGWPTQQYSSGGRKLSPRNHNTRVHPMETGSNEGTLHQRAAATKFN